MILNKFKTLSYYVGLLIWKSQFIQNRLGDYVPTDQCYLLKLK